MHIIQVITELEPAGAEKILSELSIELKKRGYIATVVILKKMPTNTTILDILKDNGIAVYSLNLSKYTPWKIFALKNLIKMIIGENKNRLTIIHSHLMHANLVCRLSKIMGSKEKIINTIHITEKRKSHQWLFLLDRLTLRYCDLYTSVSYAARNYHSERLNIDKGCIKVVNNGIMLPNKPNCAEILNLKREWGLSACSKIIGSVGRLNFQKGYDMFCDLVPVIARMIPENEIWGIVILGEGNEREKIYQKIRDVPSNIKFVLPGFRKDAAECIGTFDLFVMPSRYEGFGLVLLEAMSHGVPILASNVDSIPDLILNYHNGKCIDFNDKHNAAQCVLEYINKPKISNYKLEYTQEKMILEYIALYKDLVQQNVYKRQ